MSKYDQTEIELLTNLFSFYQKKYEDQSISTLETKFGTAARDLVESGDISENSLIYFCSQEGIKLPPKKTKPSPSTSYRSSYDDGCGRSTYRSGCR